jgi:peptidoglycan pentaglycine glycine transferase (the first glycine)
MPLQSLSEWEEFLKDYPDAHVLQSAAWGELKAGFGWQVERVCVENTGAQVLFRRLPFGLSLAYIPKGPVGPNWTGLWPEVIQLCRRKRAVLLKVEPDCWEAQEAALAVKLPGFRADGLPVQPRRTILVSLAGQEEGWLERMKQKTRYNIRLAERKGVTVMPSTDVETFHQLMLVTGQRDRFGVHSLEYYRRAYNLFHQRGQVELLIAEYEGSPLAGLMVFAHGKRAWYFYGASNDAERSRMPTYLLQWQAMRWAAGHDCTEYDLWGVPDADEEALEAQFEQRHDGLWGVYRFKRGFGGSLIRSAPTYEKSLIAPLFHFYRWYAWRRGGEQG